MELSRPPKTQSSRRDDHGPSYSEQLRRSTLTVSSPDRFQGRQGHGEAASGYRVNRAADDAAGLAISEKMRGQNGGLAQAQRNAQDAVSLVQTGEGALNEVHSMLQRIRDLKVQYSNGTLETADKPAISAEVQQLARRSRTSPRRPVQRHHAAETGTVTFQVGAESADTIALTKTESRAPSAPAAPAVKEFIDIGSATPSMTPTPLRRRSVHRRHRQAIKTFERRSTFGAIQNRLEHRLDELSTYQDLVGVGERSPTWTWPEMVNSAKPDPGAGRHEHAREANEVRERLSLLR